MALNETVMRAVRVLISTQEAGLLLPPILDGCVSLCNNTRGICIELLGDILYKLAGSIEVVEKLHIIYPGIVSSIQAPVVLSLDQAPLTGIVSSIQAPVIFSLDQAPLRFRLAINNLSL